MKSILTSIKPKYITEILHHRKTVEVRKTAPRCELPIDVYVYCTKGDYIGRISNKYVGKVVAKFTLNKIDKVCIDEHMLKDRAWAYVLYNSCLTREELKAYAGGSHPYYGIVFAWHIDDLEIFDEPKELSEFGLKRAPQSWQFIEVE